MCWYFATRPYHLNLFAVVPRICHLFLISVSAHYLEICLLSYKPVAEGVPEVDCEGRLFVTLNNSRNDVIRYVGCCSDNNLGVGKRKIAIILGTIQQNNKSKPQNVCIEAFYTRSSAITESAPIVSGVINKPTTVCKLIQW